jgi:4-hydroxy-tetrahydrodipicolinate synthase
MRGIWAAVLTPVDAELSPDAARAIPYYRDLLQRGCDGINLLGTTGEAMSLDAGRRAAFMESVAASGVPPERVMAGTGAASLGDAVRLTRRAFDLGLAAALVMPPFFFRDAPDDGIVAFFDALFSRATPPRKKVLLYNFPRMSGITFHAALVDRLVSEFPDAIAGMKESSNDARLQAEVIARHPDFLVFPGSEGDLLAAKARGVAGCISGSVALWPDLAQAVFARGDAAQGERLARNRAALDGLPFVPALRRLTAIELGDPAWERAIPPQAPLTAEQRSLVQRVGR